MSDFNRLAEKRTQGIENALLSPKPRACRRSSMEDSVYNNLRDELLQLRMALTLERSERERLEKLLVGTQRKLLDIYDANVRLTARLNELKGQDREQDKGSLEGGSGDRRANG